MSNSSVNENDTDKEDGENDNINLLNLPGKKPTHKDITIDHCSDSSYSNVSAISARDNITKPTIVIEQMESARTEQSQGNQVVLQNDFIETDIQTPS